MLPNRRRHARIRPQGMVAHLWTSEGRTPCQVDDLSAGGALLRTDHPFVPGDLVAIDLVKPGWKKAVSLSARVVERMLRGPRRLPTVSVEFTEIARDVDLRFQDFLTQMGAPPDAPAATSRRPMEPIELDEATSVDAEPLQIIMDNLDQQLLDSSPSPTPAPPVAVAASPSPTPSLPPRPATSGPQGAPSRTPASGSLSVPPRPRPSLPTPGPAPQAPPPARPQPEAILMLQVRGLLMELGEAKTVIAQREAEIGRLREELALARAGKA